MPNMNIGAWIQSVQICAAVIVVFLAFLQVMKLRHEVRFLRFVVYGAFIILVAGVAFGKYYASNAPKRFRDIEASNPSKAIAGYTEAIHLNPSNADLYYRRGRTDFHLEKYAAAIQDFTRALELSPNNPKYLVSRGFSFLFLGDVRAAETDINRALNSGYQDPEANLVHGMLLEYNGRLQEAVKEYTAALSLSDHLARDNRCSALINRANAYRKLKLYAEAERDDTLAMTDCDGSWRDAALVNRGSDKSLAGNYAGAFADWEEALRIDPNDPVVFKNRAEAYIDQGRLDLALGDYDRYLQLRPDDAYTYLVRADLYQQLGDPKRAQADRETAQELTRTNRGRLYAGPSLPYLTQRDLKTQKLANSPQL